MAVVITGSGEVANLGAQRVGPAQLHGHQHPVTGDFPTAIAIGTHDHRLVCVKFAASTTVAASHISTASQDCVYAPLVPIARALCCISTIPVLA